MNINNIINYFASFDSAGKNTSQVDTLLEYNMLGRFLNGSETIKDNNNSIGINDVKENEKQQLQQLYSGLKAKYTEFLNNKETIEVNDNNAKKYAKVLTDMEMLSDPDKTDETDTQNINKIRQGLYQYVLDNNYDLGGLQPDEINYDFVINNLLNKKYQVHSKGDIETPEESFQPNENLELQEVDMDTLLNDKKHRDGMYAINKKGVKIIYDNKYYYSPDYPISYANKNIYGLNFLINQDIAANLDTEVAGIIRGNSSESDKKQSLINFINKFKGMAFGTDKEYLEMNNIPPGTVTQASVGNFSLPFVVGDDYTPQFDYDAIYESLSKKYSEQ